MTFKTTRAGGTAQRSRRMLAALALSFSVIACSGEEADASAGTDPESEAGTTESRAMEAAAAASMAASALNAQSDGEDCQAKLDRLDALIADGLDINEAEAAVVENMRDKAAQMCAQGQGAMAAPLLDGLLEEAGAEAAEPDTAPETAEASEPAEEAPPEDYALGEPRADLDRFYGLYQLPDDPNRRLFVAPADNGNPDRPIPDGYLMVGAMWGDAANWFMKSLSDTEFEQQWTNGLQPVRVTFMTDADGNAEAMSISSRYMNYDRMERVGDLPDGWR
ncbi:hypothetical protein DDZ18_00915 [Marinicauda salina]|uniref:Uncharacterized protein n=2 Tax=Marinicauda salina TaxID=2135793 RepID=A0A2U2BW27_9PROT|nr:hypothetical protein DDZ18_00915 [Marinicauda salina]